MTDVYYYLGKYRVKVVTQSTGYWIVEALEEFDDHIDDKAVKVKIGDRRIVPVDTMHKRKYLAPPIREHSYELEMEKKLKRLVNRKEKKQDSKET